MIHLYWLFKTDGCDCSLEIRKYKLNLNLIRKEASLMLSDYLKVNTSNPPGSELSACKWLSEIFVHEQIEYFVFWTILKIPCFESGLFVFSFCEAPSKMVSTNVVPQKSDFKKNLLNSVFKCFCCVLKAVFNSLVPTKPY